MLRMLLLTPIPDHHGYRLCGIILLNAIMENKGSGLLDTAGCLEPMFVASANVVAYVEGGYGRCQLHAPLITDHPSGPSGLNKHLHTSCVLFMQSDLLDSAGIHQVVATLRVTVDNCMLCLSLILQLHHP